MLKRSTFAMFSSMKTFQSTHVRVFAVFLSLFVYLDFFLLDISLSNKDKTIWRRYIRGSVQCHQLKFIRNRKLNKP